MKSLLMALLVAGLLIGGCSAAKTEPTANGKSGAMVSMTVNDLLKRTQSGEKPLIIDVREPHEYEAGHIEGAKLMPLASVERSIASAAIGKEQEIILICRSGNRSAQAYKKLEALGYTNLKNVTGGMIEWEKVGPVSK